MVVSRSVNCSKCNKEMHVGCIDFPPYICNECCGIPEPKDYNKINSKEEYLEAIKIAYDKRYGDVDIDNVVK